MPTSLRSCWRWALGLALSAGLLLPLNGQVLAVLPVLTFIEAEFDGPQGPTNLDDPQAIATSPDGLNVYVADTSSDTITVFSRHPSTGALTFLEVITHGLDGVEGLSGVVDIVVSPDGKHVYSAAVTSSAVAAFSRDPDTGRLTFAGAKRESDPDVSGIQLASSVVVSANNLHVYVTGRLSDAVVVFNRDTTTGLLTYADKQVGTASGGTIADLDGPNGLALSPDGAFLMVASQTADAINIFSRNNHNGLLTFSQSVVDNAGGVDGLEGVTDLDVSADGLSLYAAANNESELAVFSRNAGTGALTFVEVETNGVGGVSGLNFPNDVVISPDGEHVYATGTGADAVLVFSRAAATGVLTYVETVTDGAGGGPVLDIPQGLALPPDGAQLYAAAVGDSAVTVFSRDAAAGTLTYLEHAGNVPPITGLEAPNSLEISPNGNSVYVISSEDSAVAVFQRDPASGAVSYVSSHLESAGGGFSALGGARGIAVSHDGGNFYVIGATDHAVTAFVRNAAFGTSNGSVGALFDNVGGVDGLDSPQDVEVSPDDNHVYVVSRGADNAVTVFSRSAVNGSLTFGDTLKDGEAGATGLNGAQALVISADGSFVYVAASLDHAVSVFARSSGDGLLTHLETKVHQAGGVTGLAGANDLALSPDQRHLYVTSSTGNAVTTFARDEAAGTLTYVDQTTDALDGPVEVAVSPNGRYVLVTSQNNNRLVVFERSAVTGQLRFVESVEDNSSGVDGLAEAAAVLVSPDGAHVYATGLGDDALAVFALTNLYRVMLPAVTR